jgi:hypothetical protein
MDEEQRQSMKTRRELLQEELKKQLQEAEDRNALNAAYANAQAPASTAAQMAASGVEPAKQEPPENDIMNPSLYRAEAIPVTSVPAPESPLPPVAIAQQGVQPTSQQPAQQPQATTQTSAGQEPKRVYDPSFYDKARDFLIKSGRGHLVRQINQDEATDLRNEMGRLEAFYAREIMPIRTQYEKAKISGDLEALPAEQRNKIGMANLLAGDIRAKELAGIYRLTSLGMGDEAIKFLRNSGEFQGEPSAIRFVRGEITRDGFKKDDKGKEYMLILDKDGNPLKTKGGGISAIPRNALEDLYNQYYGSKPEVIKVGPGEDAYVMDPRTQTLKPIAQGGPKESDRMAKLQEARRLIAGALGIGTDPFGNIINGGDHAKNLPNIMANVETYIIAGMTSAAAAKKAYDEYIRQQEIEKATGGKGKPSVPGVTQEKKVPAPWREPGGSR